MSVSNQNLTDDILQRFLDGELEENKYREVQELIDTDDEANTRFENLRQLNDLVAGYNRSVLSEPVPERLMLPERRGVVFDLPRIAAGILLISLGAFIGWIVKGHDPDVASAMLVDRAVAAHTLYTQEVLHTVEVPGDRKMHLGKWLSKRLGVEVKVPHLKSFDYQLLGGRVLPGDGKTAHAMLIYQRPDGARVSVYIMRSARPEHTHTLYTEKANLNVFYWRDEVLSCAVVANVNSSQDLGLLRKLSDSVYEQVEL